MRGYEGLFKEFDTNIGTVGTELTWAHIFKAFPAPAHPLHAEAMVSLLGPQMACDDCRAKLDDCGKHS